YGQAGRLGHDTATGRSATSTLGVTRPVASGELFRAADIPGTKRLLSRRGSPQEAPGAVLRPYPYATPSGGVGKTVHRLFLLDTRWTRAVALDVYRHFNF